MSRKSPSNLLISDLLPDALASLNASGLAPRTIVEYGRQWNRLARIFPREPVQSITTRMIRDARDKIMTSDKVSAGAVNNRVSAWRYFFQWAAEAGPKGSTEAYVATNPAILKSLHYSSKPQRVVSWGHVETMIEQAIKAEDRRAAAALGLMGFMGLRIAEVMAIQTSDFTDEMITISGKGRKFRTNPWDPRVKRMVDTMIATLSAEGDGARTGFIFSADNGATAMHRVYGERVVKKYPPTLGDNARVTCHALRRTFATEMYRRAMSVHDIGRLMGHSSSEVTERYIYATGDDMRKSVNEALAHVAPGVHGTSGTSE